MNEWTAEMAEWYAENYGEYPTNRLAIDALDLAEDADIIDVGCGTGAALRHASQKVTQGQLIGIDPVPRMVEIARERTKTHNNGHRIEYRVGPAEKLPLENDSADVVLAFDSFDHWQNPEEGLQEVQRVLRSGGRLVLVKDGSVPEADKYAAVMLESVEHAGFRVIQKKEIHDGGVHFTLLVSRPGQLI